MGIRPPMRHTTNRLTPVAHIASGDNLAAPTERIVARIKSNRRRMGTGSYVLGSPDGRVLVVSIGAGTAQCMIRTHERWLIGTYASGKRAEYPSVNQMMGDLAEHYAIALDRRCG